ncbi:MAG: class I SAM-dependent methyltransferase [Saprospiraceae bacterium]|nr:class I SAM-dependent methyltransferase [Saprospiraceae bacterium]MCF8252743.1 class I SAM-dependent methyltransferase [Saprospiraceae bacterium]MCF8280515.1 class I SAM-dependent methyltransferase [Bacteroidales bacterium]MCF8312303.1 class I SAM-dependent methyltransferase [Saprospiraceae bacterium]MCF8443158.1 class I SAM-dependent methyltransferase [Saprospiraceae bacterium]
MKYFLPRNISTEKMLSFLKGAEKQQVKLLPDAEEKPVLQLPIPRTPFDIYRKQKLINLLNLRQLAQFRSVLEIGCGIGDLLKEIAQYNPKELYGVDSSPKMVAYAQEYLKEEKVDVQVANVFHLPFPERAFDLVVVMVEFQHVLNNKEMERLVYEVCRVSRQWVILVEETAPEETLKDHLICRTIERYKDEMKKKHFHLRKVDILDIAATSYVYTSRRNPWHWVRWVFSPLLYLLGFPSSVMKMPTEEEKIPDSELAMKLQAWTLPFATSLDSVFRKVEGTTVMRFEREQLFRRG